MRIFFDDRMFRSKVFGGGGRYFFELINALTDRPDCEVVWFAGAYRTPLPLGTLARKCRRFFGVRLPPLGPLRQMLGPALHALGDWSLKHSGADLYHLTYHQLYASRREMPHIVTVHDLNHEQYPQFFVGDPTVQERRQALRDATAVVCVSNATRDRLCEFYPDAAPKTRVILSASSLQLPADPSLPLPGQKPYFLYVGNRNLYKNFRFLIEACASVPRFARDFSLKCYGGGEFTVDEQKLLAEHGISSCVEQLAGDDALLARLYHNAICLVYPSLEEGFGLPLLEAMNCRCAVVASRIPVFEEVAAEAAAYFDPTAREELVERLREMIEQPARRQELIRAGTRRTARFSWEQCAAEHFELYAKVLAGTKVGYNAS